MTSVFSARKFAIALGRSKRGVLATLSSIPAVSVIIERGQQANAWRIDQLSLRMKSDLELRARKMGFRDAEHLLAEAPQRFEPRDAKGGVVEIGDISVECIERATRFRAALKVPLRLKEELKNPDARKIALAAFRKELGAYASEKTFNRWLAEIIRRDAGEERFDDLALYFDKIVARKRRAGAAIPVAITAADRTLLDALNTVRNPSSPTLEQTALIWATCCEVIKELVDGGEKLKAAQRRTLALMKKSGVALARSDEALRRNLKRKYARWTQGGETFSALEDQRPHKSGKHLKLQLAEADRYKLIGHAALNCGGRRRQAYRELRDRGQLSEELLRRNTSKPSRKSYIPESIDRAIAHDVRRLAPIKRGPREHKLKGAYITRDWSVVAAGDWFQADDLTAPVYFWKTSDSERVELTRGQFLPMIDERTSYVLGFILIQSRNYNSLSIRSLITSVCAEHGLPRKGFSFERGIWKSSRILSGEQRSVDLNEVADTGLRRLGMRMRHALLPRAKVIERTLGQLQDLMESLPGYCGRNELTQKEERFARLKLDIEAGRVDAANHLLSADSLKEAYAKIIAEYNDAPQEGRLRGICPREAWLALQGHEPRARFNDATHYFLASDLRRAKVGRNGVAFKIGKQVFRYKGEETGKRQGEFVYVWFNPQRPEVLPCSLTFDGIGGVFVLERSYDVPAVDAPNDLLAAENAKISAHNRYARDLYHVVKNSLPPSMFRGLALDRKGLRFGQEIDAQTRVLSEARQSAARLERAITAKARKAGLSPVLVNRSSESLAALDEYIEAKRELKCKTQTGGK